MSSAWTKARGNSSLLAYRRGESKSFVTAVIGRELGGRNGFSNNLLQSLFSRTNNEDEGYKVIHRYGHKRSVTCAVFDAAGRNIITASDDMLVKIWRVCDGMLLKTLRGARSKICSIFINQDSSMLAVSTIDNIMTCWSLKDGQPIVVLIGKRNVQFNDMAICEIPRSFSPIRYLATSSMEDAVRLWTYRDPMEGPILFPPEQPLKLNEHRKKRVAAILLVSFSSGSSFLATTSTDFLLRIYNMTNADGPIKIIQTKKHTQEIVCLKWANAALLLLTASEDGSVLIWNMEGRQGFITYKRFFVTDCKKLRDKRRSKITGAEWNCDNTLVVTITANYLVKVWLAVSGVHLATYAKHADRITALSVHPSLPHLMCTVGMDRRLYVWSLYHVSNSDGFIIKTLVNFHNRRGGIKDVVWSNDGLTIGFGDAFGQLGLISMIRNDCKPSNLPMCMFFESDTSDVVWNEIQGSFFDTRYGVGHHLLGTDVVIDQNGIAYGKDVQARVPMKTVEGLPVTNFVSPLTLGELNTIEQRNTELTKTEVETFSKNCKIISNKKSRQKRIQDEKHSIDRNGCVSFIKLNKNKIRHASATDSVDFLLSSTI